MSAYAKSTLAAAAIARRASREGTPQLAAIANGMLLTSLLNGAQKEHLGAAIEESLATQDGVITQELRTLLAELMVEVLACNAAKLEKRPPYTPHETQKPATQWDYSVFPAQLKPKVQAQTEPLTGVRLASRLLDLLSTQPQAEENTTGDNASGPQS